MSGGIPNVSPSATDSIIPKSANRQELVHNILKYSPFPAILISAHCREIEGPLHRLQRSAPLRLAKPGDAEKRGREKYNQRPVTVILTDKSGSIFGVYRDRQQHHFAVMIATRRTPKDFATVDFQADFRRRIGVGQQDISGTEGC